jgi:predicted HAD superfamily Cof-like phosphohydrolase
VTAALQRALDLYPSPPEFVNTQGLPEKMTDAERVAATTAVRRRGSLLADEWPRMIRILREVMEKQNHSKPMPLSAEEKQHHAMLLQSELSEFVAAENDAIEQADGLLDIIVVALGGLVHMGWSDSQILAGFGEIHAANMTKVQDNGRPLINDGKISPSEPIGKFLKTHNYVRPNLAEAMAYSATQEG